MQTIGILGGMGPAATAHFYRRIVEVTAATRDQDHLRVVIDSNPAVPDRTEFLSGNGEDPGPVLTRTAQGLAAAGPNLLVIACNSASPLTERVAASVDVPVVDWPVETARVVRRAHPGASTIGLLATAGTIQSHGYDRAFAKGGTKVLAPGPAVQHRLLAK